MDFATAKEIVRGSTVFTMHTPVPAGNESFAADLIRKYFLGPGSFPGIDPAELLDLGHAHDSDGDSSEFNLTALAVRRITSYNVCYTKLLRGPSRRRLDRLVGGPAGCGT